MIAKTLFSESSNADTSIVEILTSGGSIAEIPIVETSIAEISIVETSVAETSFVGKAKIAVRNWDVHDFSRADT